MLPRILFLFALLLSVFGEGGLRAEDVSTGITTRAFHSWKSAYKGKSFWVFPFENSHENDETFIELAVFVDAHLQKQGMRSAMFSRDQLPDFIVYLGYGGGGSNGEVLGYPFFRTRNARPFLASPQSMNDRPKNYTGMLPTFWGRMTKRGGPHFCAVASVIIVRMDWQKPENSKLVWNGWAQGTHSRPIVGIEHTLINALFQNFPGKDKKVYHWKW